MSNYRRTTSCWLICQALCFLLLLQGSGIAQALPLPPKQTFVSQAELEATLDGAADPESRAGDGALDRFLGAAWNAATETGGTLKRWLEDPWPEAAPVRVAQAGGVLPLPPRLMSAVLGASSRGQSGPPSPPGRAAELTGQPAKAEGTRLAIGHKAATEEIPLIVGYNLISIPEEPADPDPAAVFAAIAPQLERVEAYDACDLTDPWKLYDPADPAASDLTVADHKIGMWVKTDAPAVLPSDGTLPETTTLNLCVGWNLIGFPAGEPRHPAAVLSQIAGKWSRVFAYDAFDSQDPWEVYDPNVPDWANDLQVMQPGRGYWVLATEAVTLEIRNQGPPPTVAITSPADLAVITEPTEVTGTVDSDRLESWTLTSRPIGDGEAVTLATGNAPVSGGTLATFDPTLLLNGLYELELTATDVQGQQVTESIVVSVEGRMKIGHFTLSFVDLAIPVSGLDIEIIRTYDSRDKQQRDFGIGWSLDIRQGSYVNNRTPGEGWRFQAGLVACDTALESKSHLTVVRLSDQEVYRFALRLYGGAPSTGGGCRASARFDFIDGPLPGTTLDILGNDQVFWETGSDRVIDIDTLAAYEPEDVRLRTRDGRVFDLDLIEGVTRLEDLNGNQLTITPTGITHSSGKSIVFDRDTEGRITQITDPLAQVMSYVYDADGDLESFTDRAGNTARFTYDGNHRLLDIEDPSGIKPLRNEYDAEGRLVRHIDATGKVIELTHDVANRREVLTNRFGVSRLLEYDARGNVVRETDELGQVTTRTFDTRDNLLTETDPLNRTTTFTYTADNDLATMTDPLGGIVRFTYDSRGKPLTVTDPLNRVTTNVYDAQGNPTQTIDALGGTSTFTYDAQGNVITVTDALGHVSTFQYDAFGNTTQEIDALGHATISTYDANGNRLTTTRSRTLPDDSTESQVTTFVYDGLGRVTSVTAADGSVTSMQYDQLGRATSRTDALGRVTTMSYDLTGRPTSTTYPDGTTTSQTYDAEGNILSRVDRAGRVTAFSYDPVGRLLTASYPDGAVVSSAYDGAGQLVSTTDARGNTATFSYDAVGRLLEALDPLGQSQTFTYDGNGNRSSMTDSRGNTTTFSYDALDRLTATTFPDGTSENVAYDALSQSIAETDPAGITTELGYDPLGRLIRVEDALGQVTSYTYDEVGNRVAQTDANGNTTSFEYDAMGRRTARVLPDGSRETMAYNADGTMVSHTDFNGATRTFDYDLNQRLIRRAYPDGSQVTFTYTPTGQRASFADARGTTSFTYDGRDRLIRKTEPTGHELSYTYDLHGNRTSLTAKIGTEVFTTGYAYDVLNRPATVTDSQGGISTLAYDENDNPTSLIYPNGVTTTYAYDGRNRLTELRSEASNGNVLQGYTYTLGAAGNRTGVDEHDGTVRSYQYDAHYRLVQERVEDAAAELIYQRDLTYDPVGNRLSRTHTTGDGNATITSAYDSRDRLLSAAATTYGWDANGNNTDKTNGGTTTYDWDFESRLKTALLPDGTRVESQYDPDGNRVRTELTTPGGAVTTVDYLVDTAASLSHVVADVNGGQVATLYTRVNSQLLSLYRPATQTSRYYHADGSNSIRALTDELEQPTDRYSYTAFGELFEHLGSDPNRYRFGGEPFEEALGLSYNRARWLDVSSGRFLSIDPFEGVISEPGTLQSYSYVVNNPVNFLDPSGAFKTGTDMLAVLGIMGFLMARQEFLHHPTAWSTGNYIFAGVTLPFSFLAGLKALGRFLPFQQLSKGNAALEASEVAGAAVLRAQGYRPVLMGEQSRKFFGKRSFGNVLSKKSADGLWMFGKKLVTVENKTSLADGEFLKSLAQIRGTSAKLKQIITAGGGKFKDVVDHHVITYTDRLGLPEGWKVLGGYLYREGGAKLHKIDGKFIRVLKVTAEGSDYLI